MSFGFPAYHKKTVKLTDPDGFRKNLDESLAALPFTMIQEDLDKIMLKAGVSIWSWGETISIDLYRKNAVTFISKCSFPLQCFDYGKNRENVELLIEKLLR